MRFSSACAILLATAPLAAIHAQDSAPVREIIEFVDRHRENSIALLEKVVNINSGSMNFSGVRAVGDLFRAKLDAMGFKTRWVDGGAIRKSRASGRRAKRKRTTSPPYRPPGYGIRAGQSLPKI